MLSFLGGPCLVHYFFAVLLRRFASDFTLPLGLPLGKVLRGELLRGDDIMSGTVFPILFSISNDGSVDGG
jgi:hypothetical protein